MNEAYRTEGRLAAEAGILHEALFGKCAPAGVILLFTDAEKAFYRCQNLSESSDPDILDLLTRGADLEAIEFFLRLTRRRNSLTRKVSTMFYLCEARAEYLDKFVSFQRTSFGLAVGQLAIACCRALLKLCKGAVLCKRFRIV